jgi:hypothetical protein
VGLGLSQPRQDLALVNGRDFLDRLAALPIEQWIAIGRDPKTIHVGPTPSNFVAAFDLGSNRPTINLVDGQGIALAAIQGLKQKQDEKDAEIQDLKARLRKLEQLIDAKTGQSK